MVKKLALSILILACFTFCFPKQIFATTIGYIDVQRVFTNYKETQKAQGQISKEEEKYKKEVENRQKKIEESKKNMKEEEIKKLIEKLEEELTPRKDELLKLNNELTSKLQTEIIQAVKDVAKELNIDIVFDKQVIITGGLDLTDLVISKLNKK